jgi:golgi phosphoprotein 3
MLTLSEELFLLSLYERKDTVALPYTAALPYALAGAMLAELALAGTIHLDKEKRVILVDNPQPTADKRANELLALISESPTPSRK